jgi:galactokinase
MDQMACALGQVAALDFERPDQPAMRIFNLNPEDYGYSLLIVNTGGSHADLTDSYRDIPYEMMSVASLFGKEVLRGLRVEDLAGKINEIRDQCGDRAFLRAYHFVTENERAQAITEAILQGDIDRYLDIVHGSAESSWKYLQNLFPNQSPRDQGLSVALAMTEEFFAKNTGGKGVCRVHGGGFAGTIQVYVPTGFLASYMQYMQRLFGKDSVFPLRVRPYGVVCIDCID